VFENEANRRLGYDTSLDLGRSLVTYHYTAKKNVLAEIALAMIETNKSLLENFFFSSGGEKI